VYYTDADGAQAVAESVAAALGGVAVEPMPDPIPTQSGKLGRAQVLVALGTAQADRTLDELSGGGTVETSGSVVVVANAAGVDGAAGAMSAELEFAGFEVGAPTNATVQRARSIVYYTDAEGAQDDAELIAELLGGVNVQPMPDEIPTESGEVDGDVLVVLGTRQAGNRLDASGQ
jgi:flavodoxin